LRQKALHWDLPLLKAGDAYPTRLLGPLLLIAVVVVAAFWRCLRLPFIQDDWTWIETFQRNDVFGLISFFFDTNYLFYRPLAQLYFLLIYLVFGDNALPFHLIALLVHIFNSLIVTAIFVSLVKDRLIGILTGLIYAVAVSVHLDTLSWMVGMYDLGAALFFFTSIWLFISGRYWLSIAAFFIAALFKESVIILPLILSGLELFSRKKLTYANLKEIAIRIFPYLIISVLIFLIKAKSSSFSVVFSSGHPYALEFWNAQVMANFYHYFEWMAQALVPMKSRFPATLVIGLILVAIVFRVMQKWQNNCEPFLFSFLVFWAVSCLLPILFLPNHVYRYYAVYALPAFICGVLILIRQLLKSFGIDEFKVKKIILVGGILIIFSSIIQSNRVFSQGLEHRTFAKGSNMLIRRAAYVDLTRTFLLKNLPVIPDNASLIFDGVDIGAFNKDAGPRAWYNNKTLNVYEFRNLRYNSGGWFIQNPAENRSETSMNRVQTWIPLDPGNFYVFRLIGGEMLRVPIDELIRFVPSNAAAFPGSAIRHRASWMRTEKAITHDGPMLASLEQ